MIGLFCLDCYNNISMVAQGGEHLSFGEILNVQRGALVFVYATALSHIFYPQKYPLDSMDILFKEKLIPTMNRTYGYTQDLALPWPDSMPNMPRSVGPTEIISGKDLSGFQHNGLKMQLEILLEEKAHLKEGLAQAQLVALVGEQGCGKGVVGSIFEEYGFSALPMSDLVKDAASVTERDRNDTQVKIDVGRELKSIFGDGILALIAVAYALEDKKNKILLDGPRITGEIDQILALGGSAIGVIVSEDEVQDREGRRKLIGLRAQKDPTRKKDVVNFDGRETQEHDLLRPILMDLSLERRIVNNFGTAEDFKEAAKSWLFGPNGLLEQEKN